MNNTITEIKNTLEGTNRRKTETKEWISELEIRMEEIAETEHNEEKTIKSMRTVSETNEMALNVTTFKS